MISTCPTCSTHVYMHVNIYSHIQRRRGKGERERERNQDRERAVKVGHCAPTMDLIPDPHTHKQRTQSLSHSSANS